ncbi:MAG: SURF1 family protein [Streptosporangiales bacterium]|nr:SURF1 family protein [Streptosporangiales bacterium]
MHLALVLVLPSFVWLGFWQLGRFERTGAPQPRPEQAAPVPLAAVAAPGERLTRADVGRLTTVQGTFDGAAQLLVADRPNGDRAGFWVLTPLRTADGVALPVVRGWVASPSDPATAVPRGTVTVTGRMQPPEQSQATAPAALPAGQIAMIRTAELINRLPYRTLYDGFLVQAEQRPAASNAPAMVKADATEDAAPRAFNWRNLAYALQWWIFAAFAVFMWFHIVRDQVRKARTADAEAAREDETAAA